MSGRVCIIGAGLAGLTAGILLRQHAIPAFIIEGLNHVGGLCRAASVEGTLYDVGCNQFGSKAAELFASLGVDQEFSPVKNEFVFGNTIISIPLNTASLCSLFYPRSIWKLKTGWRIGGISLSAVTEDMNPKFANIVKALIAYPSATSPIHINKRLFDAILEDPDGYSRPVVPVGGIESLTQKMADRFTSLGGEIMLGSSCTDIRKNTDNHTVTTQDGIEHQVETVISSIHGWDRYPETSQPGLAISAMFFKVRASLRYPEGIHTMGFFPKNIEPSFYKLNNGEEFPHNLCFHCFKNNLPDQDSCYTLTVYTLTPRGMHVIDVPTKKRILSYVMGKIEERMPGFIDSVETSYFFSPEEYHETFGLPSNVPLLLPSQDCPPVTSYDPEKDMYYIGNSVSGFAPNALGAIHSAIKAIEIILNKEPPLDLTDDSLTRTM